MRHDQPDIAGAPRVGGWWRVLQFPLTRILVATAMIAATVAVVRGIAAAVGAAPRSALGSVFALVLAAAVTATYVGYVRWIERRPVAELKPQRVTGELLRGSALGFVLCATTVLVLRLAGLSTIERGAGLAAMVSGLCLALSVGTVEEIVLRGVVFRILEDWLGSWIALAVSAAMFGLLYGFAPGATIASVLAIALQAGVLLGAAYMYARRLWFPIALHTAWSFAQLGVFGVAAEHPDDAGALSIRIAGEPILTGGEHGPDLSIVAITLCLATAAALVELARLRGLLVRPRWWQRRAG